MEKKQHGRYAPPPSSPTLTFIVKVVIIYAYHEQMRAIRDVTTGVFWGEMMGIRSGWHFSVRLTFFVM